MIMTLKHTPKRYDSNRQHTKVEHRSKYDGSQRLSNTTEPSYRYDPRENEDQPSASPLLKNTAISVPEVPSVLETKGEPFEPDAHFEMIGDVCTLKLFWPNVSPKDISAVARGQACFGLWYSGQNDIFFMYRFGNDPWADTAFSIMQLPADKRIQPTTPGSISYRRLKLNIELIDIATQMVRCRRVVTLSMAFSRKLSLSVLRQFTKRYLSFWTPDIFYRRCSDIFTAYPTPLAMLKAPGCVCCRTE